MVRCNRSSRCCRRIAWCYGPYHRAFNHPADDSPRRRHSRAEVSMPPVDRSPTARAVGRRRDVLVCVPSRANWYARQVPKTPRPAGDGLRTRPLAERAEFVTGIPGRTAAVDNLTAVPSPLVPSRRAASKGRRAGHRGRAGARMAGGRAAGDEAARPPDQPRGAADAGRARGAHLSWAGPRGRPRHRLHLGVAGVHRPGPRARRAHRGCARRRPALAHRAGQRRAVPAVLRRRHGAADVGRDHQRLPRELPAAGPRVRRRRAERRARARGHASTSPVAPTGRRPASTARTAGSTSWPTSRSSPPSDAGGHRRRPRQDRAAADQTARRSRGHGRRHRAQPRPRRGRARGRR